MSEQVAIVGIACRFPGSEDLASFRKLLHAGRCAIGAIPQVRLEDGLQNRRAATGDLAEQACRWGGFLDGIDRFDAAFFRISPVEARLLDPQQRLLLETSWWALEDAGIDPSDLKGTRTGVFVGISTSDYRELIVDDDASLGLHAATGTSASTAAGRIAFTLGLEGPTMALDTSSSSSLVAVHQAVSAVQSKEADLALAGGANALLSASQTAALANAGMLSPDGVCRAFDARANGYVRAEGCGMIVLRRLAEAEASGDRILGVIRGSAINQDGAGGGLTVPNRQAQIRVIGEALSRARLKPSEVNYLEAHGTGTKLGDPIEVTAAAAAYGKDRETERPLLIGSVKTNIGHLEAAAGIAGLIKVVLALQDGVIPAHLNFERPQPDIDWESIPVRVATTSTSWPSPDDRRRRAGISSFGFSGTNAHVLIEEYRSDPASRRPVTPDIPAAPSSRDVRVLPLSGRSEAAVRALAGRYRDRLTDRDGNHSKDHLADLAWTAGIGRHHFAYRTGLTFTGTDDLLVSLEEVENGSRSIGCGSASRVGFLFTGQGSQWSGMGRYLYESEPVVRSVLDRCDRAVGELSGESLLAVMFGEGDLDDTTWTQPALYALECGLCAWWESAGIRPAAVLGHSVGEIAAAHAAGMFSLEDGARFAARRGALMGSLARDTGTMMAVFAPSAEMHRLLGGVEGVALAADNGSHCVVSGPSSSVASLERTLRSAGIRTKNLRTSHAFHSALMDPALDRIEASAATLQVAMPTVPLVSNVTGQVLEKAPDSSYWRLQAREMVRFSDSVATLDHLGIDLLIEVGPGPVLVPLAQECWTGTHEPNAIVSLDGEGGIGEAISAAYEAGLPVSFDALFAGERRRRASAPTYPFQRRRHWLASPQQPSSEAEPAPEETPLRREPDLPARLKQADDPEALLTAFLQEQIQAVLGLDQPPPGNVGFFDLGLDSLLAAQLRSRINQALAGSFKLSGTALFSHPDTASMARYLTRRLNTCDEAPQIVRATAVDEPVAIVGMACRFPGGEDLNAFRELLDSGSDAVSDPPADRLDLTGRNIFDRMPVRAGFISGIDRFDAEFFRIAPVEARLLDPQQRLLLETSWRALEDAGIAPHGLRGSPTGVYAGVFTSDYRDMMVQAAAMNSAYAATGVSASTAVGRVAFALGLEGPAIAVDTACSSSLVALHQAASALRRGEADLALAGGVNAILSMNQMAAFGDAGMLAPDGRCKTFDAQADGYVRGEGCGMVVLRRLSEAEAEGDRILAVIRGSAINQDGASAGLTVPNGRAQERVIRASLAQAGIEPSGVDYLEAHGTGTELGDPIEVEAASTVYGEGRANDRPLLIGSVKTNIGHLEAAAGIAGVIKVVLALQQGRIPRHLHFETPTPRLDWPSLPVQVAAEATAWPEHQDRAPRAAVSSFGFSGTNAHVIIEGWHDTGAPQVPLPENVSPAPGERQTRILPLSGRTPAAVRTLADRYADWLSRLGGKPSFACLSDCAWTAATGRNHFPHRVALTFRDGAQLRDRLTALASAAGAVGHASRPRRVGFLFTGQGSQWPGMGRQLYECEPVFRSILDRCDRVIRELRGISLCEAMFGDADLQDTAWTQPCLYALACGLASLWENVGVRPAAVLGHSVGELAAARTAGLFRLEDGARLAALRGSLMGSLERGQGAMAAICAPQEDVRRAIQTTERVSLAAENGPHSVISGDADAVAEICEAFRVTGVRVERLRTSHAFHSAQMEPVLDEIESCAAGLATDSPTIPLVSTLTGRVLEQSPDGAYWRRQARDAVRFSSAVETLHGLDVDLLIEVGPASVLGPLALECWPDTDRPTAIASLTRGGSFTEALAAAYDAGVPLSFEGMFSGERRRRIAIPGHPFHRRRHWLDQLDMRPGTDTGTLLGRRTDLATGGVVFERDVSATHPSWLADHRVFDQIVVPGAWWGFLMMSSMSQVDTTRPAAVEDLQLHAPLILEDGERRNLQIALGSPDGDGGRGISVFSRKEDGDSWIRHVEARVVTGEGPASPRHHSPAPNETGSLVSGDRLRDSFARIGLIYGPTFHGIETYRHTADGAVAELVSTADPEGKPFLPAMLDAAIQVALATADDSGDALHLPFGWQRLWITESPPDRLWCHVFRHPANANTDSSQVTWSADIRLIDDSGEVVGEFVGLIMRRATRSTLLSASGGLADLLHETVWQECPLPASRPLAPIQPALAVAAWPTDGSPFLADESLDDERLIALDDGLRQLACAWARATLEDLGWQPVAGDVIDLAALRRRLRVVSEHEPLFRRLFELLGETDLLVPSEDGWTARSDWPEPTDPASLASALTARLPHGSTELSLLARCGAALGDVMRARAEPDTILAEGGIRNPVDLVGEAPRWRAALRRALQPLAAMVGSLPENGRLKVLTVGAPGISQLVREITSSQPVEVATLTIDEADRSRPESWFATDRLTVWPAVDGRPSDPPDRSPDVVILPSGLLRNAPDPGVIQEHCLSILVPSGCLLILDDCLRRDWLDICFGLHPSWLRHTGNWREALEAAGFINVTVCSADAASTQSAPEITLVLGQAPAQRSETTGTWLLHAAGEDAAETLMADLAHDLAKRGQTVVVAGDGSAGETSGTERIGIQPDNRDSWRSAVDGLDKFPPLHGIVALIGSFRDDAGENPDQLTGEVNRIATRVLALMQGLVDADAFPPAGVSFVTRGGRATGRERRHVMAPSILWGMVQTAAREVPLLRPRLIDLDPDTPATVTELAAETLRPDDESLVAWRAGARFVPRLSPAGARPLLHLPPDGLWQVAAGAQGTLDGLWIETGRQVPLGPGEIRVRIDAAGLNFHDVLIALGLVDVGSPLGTEFCGSVLETGPGVEHLKPDQRVVGFAVPAFAPEAVVRAELVTTAPAGLASAALATLPIVFATALLAFRDAGLGPGQRVLVHAASGGVGHAAIGIARMLGAEVLATASATKRAYVRTLGVRQVFDSRSTRFAADVTEATEGRGVDVVLNSLTGEGFIEASLSCLVRGGHFVEIAKRGIWSPARMAEMRPDIGYSILAVDELIENDPERVGSALREVMAGVEDGILAPLPLAVRSVTQTASAMEMMRAGRHTGKLVLTMPGLVQGRLRSAGPYLVTGGLGGLGLQVAEWLIARGVQTIILNARTAPDPVAEAAIRAMRKQGTTVRVELADVADKAAVDVMLVRLARDLPPLTGVFHCAGVLSDGALENQDSGRFERVLAPKAFGAWNLHCATRHLDLEHFVMFSSVVGVVGNPGQANYAAANAFLDQLAQHRRSLGLAGQSIAWGAWTGSGMAASHRTRMDGWSGGWITPRQGLLALDRILEQGMGETVVTALDGAALEAQTELRSPFLERFHSANASPAAPADDLQARLHDQPPADREGFLVSILQTEIRAVLGLQDIPPPTVGFFDLGMDSLTAIELRERLNRMFAGAGSVSSTVIFDHPDAISLARRLLHDFGLAVTTPSVTVGTEQAAARERDRIGSLSGDDLLAEMESRLGDRR